MMMPGDDNPDQDAAVAESEVGAEAADGEQDELAAEWESMVGNEDGEATEADAVAGEQASKRVLDQAEIDSLLGFEEEEGEGVKSGIQAILSSASWGMS